MRRAAWPAGGVHERKNLCRQPGLPPNTLQSYQRRGTNPAERLHYRVWGCGDRLKTRRVGANGKVTERRHQPSGATPLQSLGCGDRLKTRRVGANGKVTERRHQPNGATPLQSLGCGDRLKTRRIGANGKVKERRHQPNGATPLQSLGCGDRLKTRRVGANGKVKERRHQPNGATPLQSLGCGDRLKTRRVGANEPQCGACGWPTWSTLSRLPVSAHPAILPAEDSLASGRGPREEEPLSTTWAPAQHTAKLSKKGHQPSGATPLQSLGCGDRLKTRRIGANLRVNVRT